MVHADDNDAGPNGTLTYSIRASNLYRPGTVLYSYIFLTEILLKNITFESII